MMRKLRAWLMQTSIVTIDGVIAAGIYALGMLWSLIYLGTLVQVEASWVHGFIVAEVVHILIKLLCLSWLILGKLEVERFGSLILAGTSFLSFGSQYVLSRQSAIPFSPAEFFLGVLFCYIFATRSIHLATLTVRMEAAVRDVARREAR